MSHLSYEQRSKYLESPPTGIFDFHDYWKSSSITFSSEKEPKKDMKSYRPRFALQIKETVTDKDFPTVFTLDDVTVWLYNHYGIFWGGDQVDNWHLFEGQVSHTLDFWEHKGFICYLPDDRYTTIYDFYNVKTEILIQQNEC